MQASADIQVDGLRKRYGEITAVDGATFAVSKGEVFGLLGPNGAGKTTAVECILGLRQPDAGELQVLGVDRGGEVRSVRARMGVQLQTTGLLDQLKVREQVSLFAGLFPRSLSIDPMLEKVGLIEEAKLTTKSLSGGQKQRLALALALINDPDLVFLDEPTTGLDPQARRRIWEVILDLKSRGRTVLLTTHYMEEAEQLCDRVAIMDHGKIIELEPPVSLINKHFNETAIEFVAVGEAPKEKLRSLPAVAQTTFENGRITLYSTDVPQTMAGLFGMVSGRALDFKDMVVRQATLEDVFLKLTGRRIRA